MTRTALVAMGWVLLSCAAAIGCGSSQDGAAGTAKDGSVSDRDGGPDASGNGGTGHAGSGSGGSRGSVGHGSGGHSGGGAGSGGKEAGSGGDDGSGGATGGSGGTKSGGGGKEAGSGGHDGSGGSSSGCTRDRDCDDDEPCTTDQCQDRKCTHTASNSACAEGEYCNADKGCVGKSCKNDDDCKDADDCTILQGCDKDSGKCVWAKLDQDGDGYAASSCGGDDCDDENAAVHPGVTDTCNGRDDDCDGDTDEDATCTLGRTCQDGACACSKGRTLCGDGTCADTSNDAHHCGASCSDCGTGGTCSDGACACDTSGPVDKCGQNCVDTRASDANCGACNHSCAVPANCPGGGRCMCFVSECIACGGSGDHCCETGPACGPGLICDGPPAKDVSKCVMGTCGGNGQACCQSGTTCNIGLACSAEPGTKGAKCEPCGGADQPCCGTFCGNGYQCRDSVCSCPAPSHAVCGMNNACVNLEDSLTNCGACAHACATGGQAGNELCVAGECAPCGHAAGQRCCAATLATTFGPHVCFTDKDGKTLTCDAMTDQCEPQQ